MSKYERNWMKWGTAALAVTLALAGCSAMTGSASTDDDEDDVTAEETVSEEEEAEEDDATSAYSNLAETVIVDNDYVSVTATASSLDAYGYLVIDLTVVNKTDDTDLTVSFDDDYTTVDGVMSDAYGTIDVSAGKTAYDDVSVSVGALIEEGVPVTDVQLHAYVYPAGDYSADGVAEATCHLYPQGEGAATTYVRESADSDQVLLDDDHVCVTVVDTDYANSYYEGVLLYIENRTDDMIYVTAEDVSLDDVMCDPYWGVVIYSGASTFSLIGYSDSDLSGVGLTEWADVTSMEMSIEVWDWDTLETLSDGEATITL